MPRHRTHRAIDKAVLGKRYSDVHRFLDRPYSVLGPRHRILRHEPFTPLAIYGPGEKFVSAILHILADTGGFTYRTYRPGRGRRRKKKRLV